MKSDGLLLTNFYFRTTSFKSSLHAASKDRESRRDKNREDKLLHHRLDKLVKEEARTNKKVSFTYYLVFLHSI